MRVYAKNRKTGDRILLYLECDFCDAKIRPGPEIADSGWEKRGLYYGPGDERNGEVCVCPKCARER